MNESIEKVNMDEKKTCAKAIVSVGRSTEEWLLTFLTHVQACMMETAEFFLSGDIGCII